MRKEFLEFNKKYGDLIITTLSTAANDYQKLSSLQQFFYTLFPDLDSHLHRVYSRDKDKEDTDRNLGIYFYLLIDSSELEIEILRTSEYLSRSHGQKNALQVLSQITNPHIDIEAICKTEKIHESHLVTLQKVQLFYLLHQQQIAYYRAHPQLKDDAFEKMQEAKMWIDEQLKCCITGIKFLIDKSYYRDTAYLDKHIFKSKMLGVYKHTECVIGLDIEDYFSKQDQAILDTEMHIRRIKSELWYQHFTANLSNRNRLGYNSYFSPQQLSDDELKLMIDAYLFTQIDLNQALFLEQELVVVTKALVASYPLPLVYELINALGTGEEQLKDALHKMSIPESSQKVETFALACHEVLKQPAPLDKNIRERLERINRAYLLALIKLETFSEKGTPPEEKLRWSVMWIDLQKTRIMSGLARINHKLIYDLYERDGKSASAQSSTANINARLTGLALKCKRKAESVTLPSNFIELVAFLTDHQDLKYLLYNNMALTENVFDPQDKRRLNTSPLNMEATFLGNLTLNKLLPCLHDTLDLKMIFYALAKRGEVGMRVLRLIINELQQRLPEMVNKIVTHTNNPSITLLDAIYIAGPEVLQHFLSEIKDVNTRKTVLATHFEHSELCLHELTEIIVTHSEGLDLSLVPVEKKSQVAQVSPTASSKRPVDDDDEDDHRNKVSCSGFALR